MEAQHKISSVAVGFQRIHIIALVVVGVIMLVMGIGIGYVYGVKKEPIVAAQTAQLPSAVPTISINICPTVPAVSNSQSSAMNNSNPVQIAQGASLQNIKYTLPTEWTAKINESNRLFIAPNSGGGYLSISAFSYPTTIGRREYFCQVTHACIANETQFTVMQIGNISGYMATRLDNSGGGPEYFGAKGSTFYVIASYNPPSPNQFEKEYKQVLSSLVF